MGYARSLLDKKQSMEAEKAMKISQRRFNGLRYEEEQTEEILEDMTNEIKIKDDELFVNQIETQKVKNEIIKDNETLATINSAIGRREEEVLKFEKELDNLKNQKGRVERDKKLAVEIIVKEADKISNSPEITVAKLLKRDTLKTKIIQSMKKISKIDIFEKELTKYKDSFKNKIMQEIKGYKETISLLKGTIEDWKQKYFAVIKENEELQANQNNLIDEAINLIKEEHIKELSETESKYENKYQDKIVGLDADNFNLNYDFKIYKIDTQKEVKEKDTKIKHLEDEVKTHSDFTKKYQAMENTLKDKNETLSLIKEIYPQIDETVNEYIVKKAEEELQDNKKLESVLDNEIKNDNHFKVLHP